MKVSAIIQARIQSTRLPGKVLFALPQPNGKIVLEHIVDQIKKSNHINTIVLAIPEGEPDTTLFERAKKIGGVNGIVRGPEYNVLQRFLNAADLFPAEYIVRLTGDNPLIDATIVDATILFMKNNSSADYVCTTGLPIGLNVEMVKVNALRACIDLPDLGDADKEHVTFGVRSRPHIFNVTNIALDDLWNDTLHARFTLDTPEDYTFLNAVFYGLNLNNYRHDIQHLKKLLKQAPWMTVINQHAQQKQPGVSNAGSN